MAVDSPRFAWSSYWLHPMLALLVLVSTGCREAVEQARAEHQRKVAENNLRQVELAVQNYERAAAADSAPASLRVVSWNIESGGNDAATISRQLAELGPYDVFALQEVRPVQRAVIRISDP
jgi:hypothetical protein